MAIKRSASTLRTRRVQASEPGDIKQNRRAASGAMRKVQRKIDKAKGGKLVQSAGKRMPAKRRR